MMALDGAGEAFADGGAGHIDLLADLEQIHLQLGANADLSAFAIRQAEFPQATTWGNARLGEMTGHRFGHPAGATAADRHLQGTVAIGFLVLT
jgi:hypothetical protein